MVIWPVFIAPLFNHYSPLPDGPLKAQILSLARANDVPVDNVWLVDASRQSNRISANVSGFLGTTRISLNDNLLKQGTPDEVLAVLGHEMGHYVMDHATRADLLLGLVIMRWALPSSTGAFCWPCELFGGHWQVRKLGDMAGLPLLVALVSIYHVSGDAGDQHHHPHHRTPGRYFRLDAVRKPDAFATVMLKLSTYRKLEPGKWEEIIFYDHPSGRTRIQAVMGWKKEHIGDPDMRDTRRDRPPISAASCAASARHKAARGRFQAWSAALRMPCAPRRRPSRRSARRPAAPGFSGSRHRPASSGHCRATSRRWW